MTKPYLIIVILFFFTVRIFAQAPAITYAGLQTYAYNASGSSTARISIATVNAAISPPSISYSGAQTYTAFTPIAPLAPASSGVAPLAYSSGTTALGSGFNKPGNVALDAAGNVYVTDAGNNAIKKIPKSGGAPVTVGSGFNNPTGVAVDAAGNVFVADFGNKQVKKIPIGGGAPVIIGSGFRFPTDVAVDAAGNVYVADNSYATPPTNGGSSGVAVKVIPANSDAVFTLFSGFMFIKNIALDVLGNVYVTETGTAFIQQIPVGIHSNYLLNFVGPYLNYKLTGVSTDPSGNLYVADGSSNMIKVLPANGGAPFFAGPAFGSMGGIKTDAAGNIFVADANGTSIAKIKPIGGYYISPSLPSGLKFDNATGIISGTPTVGSPATVYTITAYNNAGVSSSDTVSIKVNITAPSVVYDSPKTYTIGNAITPLVPTSKYVDAFNYNNPVTLGSGFSSPLAVAADDKGNVYVTDTGHGLVKKIPAGGGATVTIGSGYISPQGIAVDTTGNVYVTDPYVNKVYKIPANGSPQISIGAGFSQPTGIAVDKAGNVYIGNNANNTLTKIPADGTAQVTLNSHVAAIGAIAVDDAGNLYESNQFFRGGLVVKVPADGSPAITLDADIENIGIEVDASGYLFVTSKTSGELQRFLEDKIQIPGHSLQAINIDYGFNNPSGIDIDKKGVLYIADSGNNAIKEITPSGGYYLSPALPAGLSFNNITGAISGTPVVANPATNYTVTAYNKFGSNSTTLSIATSVSIPTITASAITGKISACSGTASASPNIQQFTVSGKNLTTNISATAPTGFEVSLSQGSAFSNIVQIKPIADSVSSTIIYVRSSASASGIISGNVVLSSTGAPSQNIAISGTINALPTVNAMVNQIVAAGTSAVIAPFSGTADTYTWVNTNPDIGLPANGVGNIPQFTSTNNSNGPISGTITVTPSSSAGCVGTLLIFTVTVTPKFTLPTTNFKLAITSATCKGSNNGSVNITATKSLGYTATITGNGLNTAYPFTASTAINDLAAGTYHVCITVAGQPDYSQCNDVVITEPKDLSVYSVINADNSLTLALSGASQYNIQLNGISYNTLNSSINLPLAEGNNDLTVTTDKLCQGSFKKLINVATRIMPYPVPFQNTLNLNVGNTTVNHINIEIHNVSDGKLVFTQQYVNQAGVIQLDLTNLRGGIYALHLSTNSSDKIFKVIKK